MQLHLALVSHRQEGTIHDILRVRVRYRKWFRWREYEAEFIGWSTVWHTYPGFRRVSSEFEAHLAELHTKVEFEKEQKKRGYKPS